MTSLGSSFGHSSGEIRAPDLGLVMESLERDLSCPVCLEMFNKPVLLLPCQHNLCRHCAEDILTNMGGWARYGGSFKCPTCRDQITLGRQGLDGLKRNILVETIIESYRVAQSAGIKTAPPGGGAYCRDHKDERVNLYCVTDERPICGLCVIGQHNQHNIIELQTIFKEKKEKIETEMNRLQQKNSDMSKEMSDIQATLRIIEGDPGSRRKFRSIYGLHDGADVESKCKDTKAKLLSECESLITLINERKDALVEKLEKEQRESSRTLREQIASRQTRLDKSKKTAAWVEDMLGKKDVAQFIQNVPELEEKISKEIAQEVEPRSEEAEAIIRWDVNFSAERELIGKMDFCQGEEVPFQDLVAKYVKTPLTNDTEDDACCAGNREDDASPSPSTSSSSSDGRSSLLDTPRRRDYRSADRDSDYSSLSSSSYLSRYDSRSRSPTFSYDSSTPRTARRSFLDSLSTSSSSRWSSSRDYNSILSRSSTRTTAADDLSMSPRPARRQLRRYTRSHTSLDTSSADLSDYRSSVRGLIGDIRNSLDRDRAREADRDDSSDFRSSLRDRGSSALDRADRATTSSPADDDFGSALRARRTAAASALERIERTTAALLDDASDYRSPSSYRTTSALDRANSALERGSSALERTSALLEGRRAERTERASAILGTERDRDRDRDRNESLSTSSRHDDIDTSAMSLLSRSAALRRSAMARQSSSETADAEATSSEASSRSAAGGSAPEAPEGPVTTSDTPAVVPPSDVPSSTSEKRGLLFRLDPKTAHRDLKLTNGNLTVEWDPDYDIDVEDSVERFLGYSVAVLGDKAISSGRHYWEIDVSESRTYRIGVCSRDAQRDSIIGNTEDGWVLRRNAREYTLRHDVNSPVRLAMQHDLDKIGILLDYNRGELAFYNADIGLRLHTLKAHFVSPICPAFSLWDGVVTVVSGCPWPDFLLN
ncbi:serine-rich adhesin for platelets-like isoform X2 [Branchiostoma floridae]|nr:serine-rich adhesin for platelets-like isoform X2 [Branchiostoma floridae]XP_035670060.1 serine-rich adhesin for platelets-like isoform X2 [Branchiostoma floridae]